MDDEMRQWRRMRRNWMFWGAPPVMAGGPWAAPFPGPAWAGPMGPGAMPMGDVEHEHGHGHGRRGRRGGWGAGPWGGGPRARRGDVRAAVLGLLDEQPMHGYQLIQELEARSGGSWRPSPGSIYPTLQLLEDEGLVTAEQVEGKKVFSLTDDGRAQLASLRARSATPPWEELADDAGDLRRQLKDLAVAVMQVARAGDEDQVRRAQALLNETRKKVYGILAEGD